MNRENGFVHIPTPAPPHIDSDEWYRLLERLAGRPLTDRDRQSAARLVRRGMTLEPIARQLFGGRDVDARIAVGALRSAE